MRRFPSHGLFFCINIQMFALRYLCLLSLVLGMGGFL